MKIKINIKNTIYSLAAVFLVCALSYAPLVEAARTSTVGGGSGSGVVGTGATGQFPYYAGAGEELTATSNIFLSGSSIGIGTTTPAQKLSVAGSISSNGTLGSNLITNGDFASGDLTGWSGTNWSYSSGGALHTAGSLEPLVSSTFSPTIGQTYRVDFDIVARTAGYVTMYFGGNYGKTAILDGTYTEYITAATSTGFNIYPESDFAGRIDNVVVRLLTTTGTSTIETPIDFRKKVYVQDRIEFPEGKPVIIGYNALVNNERGIYNVSSSNVAIGYEACKNVKTGQCTGIGYQAGKSQDYDLDPLFEASLTAIGKWAGFNNTSGHATFVGNAAGRSNTTGDSHCVGDEACALSSTTTVTALGSYASYGNLYGNGITAVGRDASRSGTNPEYSTVVGAAAGYNSNSKYAAIYGYQSAYTANDGSKLACFGDRACRLTTTGDISAFGKLAGYNLTTGRGIYLGNGAGLGSGDDPTYSPTTDTDFIFLGGDTTRNVTAATARSNYIVIGYGARNTASNQVVLGNDSITQTLLKGNVGIASSSPFAKLAVGSANATTQFPLFHVASSSSAVATSSALVVNWDSKVGIGTSTPVANLSVVGTSGQTADLFRISTSTGASAVSVNGDASRLSINSAGSRVTAGGLIGAESSYGGIWIGVTPTANNYSVIGNGFNTWVNSPNGAVYIRNNEVNVLTVLDSKVGIGSTTPWRTFSVVGTMAVNGLSSATGGNAVCISATTFDIQNAGNTTCVTSALRFKENIKDLAGDVSLEKLSKLRPVSFDYKEGYHDKNESAGSYGLIAEDVEKVDPLLVDYCDDGKVCTLHFEKITGLLVSAIREIYSEFQGVVARLSGLENKLEKQQKQIDELMKRVEALED